MGRKQPEWLSHGTLYQSTSLPVPGEYLGLPCALASLTHVSAEFTFLKWLLAGARTNLGNSNAGATRVTKKPVISIVDDDESVRAGTMDLFKALGFEVVAFPRAADFLCSDHLRNTCCLIADVQMPGMTGIDLYSRLIESGNSIPTILITAYPDDADRTSAL